MSDPATVLNREQSAKRDHRVTLADLLLGQGWNKQARGYLFSGKIYPDGRFGIGRNVAHSVRPVTNSEWKTDAFAIESCRVLGVRECLDLKRISAQSKNSLPDMLDGDQPTPLVLTNCSNSHTRKARGSNGITKHGRRLIENVVREKQRRYGRSVLAFGTFTVPPLCERDLETLQSEWPNIVRVFLQRVSRMLRRGGLPTGVTGCVEIQPERFRRTGQAYPHLHLVWVGRRHRDHWAYSPSDYRRAWLEVLHQAVGQAIDTEGPSGENVVPVRKSVQSYLSKYISKGFRSMPDSERPSNTSFVKSWYICSLQWRQWFHKATVHVSGAVAEFLVLAVEDGWNGLSYSNVFQLPQGEGFDRPITIGWYGRLKGWAKDEVVEYKRHAA